MTKLEAVCEILDAIGESHATALNPGTSIEGQAETFLNRWDERIQRTGWHVNKIYNITLDPPDTTIAYSVAPSGTFVAGETVTETTSGATGRLHEVDTVAKLLYITQASDSSADFTGSQVLTGGTSAATVTGTTLAAVTEGRILLDSDVLSADSYGSSAGVDVAVRGGALFDIENDTDVFSDSIVIKQTELVTFADLPQELQEYITLEAAAEFQRKKLGATEVRKDLAIRLLDARNAAYKDDASKSGASVLTTQRAYTSQGRSVGTGHTR